MGAPSQDDTQKRILQRERMALVAERVCGCTINKQQMLTAQIYLLVFRSRDTFNWHMYDDLILCVMTIHLIIMDT